MAINTDQRACWVVIGHWLEQTKAFANTILSHTHIQEQEPEQEREDETCTILKAPPYRRGLISNFGWH